VGVTSISASGLIAQLTAALERAEADIHVDLAETDALLEELRFGVRQVRGERYGYAQARPRCRKQARKQLWPTT